MQSSRTHRDRTTVRQRRRLGFTMIEIMIVVCIMEVLIAISIPGLVNARETSRSKACSKNLQNIQSALQQYAVDKKLPGSYNESATWQTDLIGTGKYLKSTPACPSRGSYTIGTIDTDPTCSGDRPTTRYRHTVSSF